MFQDYRHADIDQSGKAQADKHAVDYYAAGLYNGLDPNSYFVENGTYLKLRELSVNYALGQRALEFFRFLGPTRHVKVALVGRNLYTWTKFSGFDPEATSGGDLNFRIEGFKYPSFRQITGQVEIGF